MSTRKEKNGTWTYVVDLGKDEHGKRVQKMKRGFKTKGDASKAERELLHDFQSGNYIKPTNLKVEEYMNDWLKRKIYSIALQTAENYESYLRVHINPAIGHLKLNELTPLTIENFIMQLREKSLAESTIKRIYSVLHTALGDAEKTELIRKNVASMITNKPKENKEATQVWSADEAKKFLKVAKESGRYYIAFLLALSTGMRQGELLGLRWQDIDFSDNSLKIQQTLSHNGKHLKSGAKTSGSLRTIALDEGTINELLNHKKMIELEREIKDYEENDLVVCTEVGAPKKSSNISKLFGSLNKKAKVPKIRFHDLRHTHATLLISLNENVKVVSERLGHSSVQITLDTYTHLNSSMQKSAALKIGQLNFC